MVDKDGYFRLSLGKVDNVCVHRVVCESFYGSPPAPNSQVNHIDCDRQNNHVLNLQWCSPSENIRWAIYKGNLDPMVGLRRAAEVNPKPVMIVELDMAFGSVKECAEFLGVKPTCVSRCLIGERRGQALHGYHIVYI
jgi:hypothetical protein